MLSTFKFGLKEFYVSTAFLTQFFDVSTPFGHILLTYYFNIVIIF